MRTTGIPAIRLRVAVNPFEWYSGAGMRIRWASGSGPYDSTAAAIDGPSMKTPGLFIMMTLGVPVDPELQMPQARGAITSGSGSVGAVTAATKRSR